ncbi:MAG: ComEC/Rec2 family competence protein, partial [Alphaproteobacteria bacterium]|nr:ComEC/Rec2 family competence protein [Alphaproteobacteria bacterium]
MAGAKRRSSRLRHAVSPGLREGWQWLRQELALHRERLLLYLPVFFGCGIVAYFTLTVEPEVWVAATITGVAWLLVLGLRLLKLGGGFALWLSLALAMAATGMAVSQWRTLALRAPMITETLGPVTVSGRIAALDSRTSGTRMVLAYATLVGREELGSAAAPPPLPPVLRLTARGGLERDTMVGDWVQFRAVLTRLHDPVVVGGFDIQRYLYFYGIGYGIGGSGFLVSPLRYLPPPATEPSGLWQGLMERLDEFRWRLSYRLIEEIPGDSGAMVAALVVGDQGQIRPSVLQAMRDSGLAHILSISGLHISLMAVIMIVVVRGGLALIPTCALYWPIKQIAGVTALLAVTGYGFLAGINQVPVLRSLVMIAVPLVAMILGRRALSLLTWSWAAMISLLITPEQILGPSFQLSFAAVLVLLTIADYYQSHQGQIRAQGLLRRLGFWLVMSIGSSLAITLATAPISSFVFHRTTVYGVFANLLAVPLSDFVIMPMVVAELILYPLGWDGWLHPLLGAATGWMIDLARFFAALPHAVIVNRAFSGWGFVILELGALWLCLWRGWLRWLGVVVALVGLVVAMATLPPQLIIGRDGRNFAYLRAGQQMVLARQRLPPLTAESWAQTLGAVFPESESPHDWDTVTEVSQLPGSAIGCGVSLCRSDELPKPLLWVRDEEGIVAACKSSQAILISHLSLPRPCGQGNLLFDQSSLSQSGAVSLWFDSRAPDGVRSESVN